MDRKGLFNMKDGCKVKICGTTNIQDAKLAAREGADYFGVVVEVIFQNAPLLWRRLLSCLKILLFPL